MFTIDEKKRLYFKAKRRGMIELDLVLGFVADHYLNSFNDEELALFSNLLDTEDNILYQWLFQNKEIPLQYQANIWPLVKSAYQQYINNNL